MQLSEFAAYYNFPSISMKAGVHHVSVWGAVQ